MPDGHPRPPLDTASRRRLAARGNRLHAHIVVGKAGVTDAVADQIRREIARSELVKVRVLADHGAEADAVGEELASRIPCHVVARVGKVILLYEPAPPEANKPAPSRPDSPHPPVRRVRRARGPRATRRN